MPQVPNAIRVAQSSQTMSADEATFMPSAPECMAPSNPGDGSDFTCRSVAQALVALGLVTEDFKVTNMTGGGGGVAYRQAGSTRQNDDNLIIAASPSTTLSLAQAQYDQLTVEDVRWLGVVAADYGVIAVPVDSPFQTLADVFAAIAVDPESVYFGGGDPIGGQDYMKLMLLAQSAEIAPNDLPYIPFEGGGDVLNAMSKGFVDVFPGDVSEVLPALEAGDLRLLAVLTPERIASLPDVPTATEAGYEAQWVIFRGFYAPGAMSDEAFAWWSSMLEEMAGTPEWAEIRTATGMDEFFMAGDEFGEMVKGQIADFADLSASFGGLSGG